MIDTAFFKITQNEVGDVDFLEEIPCFLENIAEHYCNGQVSVSGYLNGLHVLANAFQLKVKNGSLCKFYLGDNLQTMGRRDVERAIEKLSDHLHVPMSKAIVTRLDLGQNLIMKYQPEVYFNHLGQLRYANRLMEPNGLYYLMNGRTLAFYDKSKERKSHHDPLPQLYKKKNVLRYEMRFLNRLQKRLGEPEVTASLLYNERFYVKALKLWKENYCNIQKINDRIMNFEKMTTKKDAQTLGLLALMEMAGGQLKILSQIDEKRRRGDLTKKQAYDLRQMFNDACKVKDGLVIHNDAIRELDKKVVEAIRFYR